MSTEGGWRSVASDPNSRDAVAVRQQQLDAAWAPSPPDRLTFIRERCAGKRVLDLGCAGQATTVDDPRWLHRNVLEVAASVVGADYERDEVARLQAEGFDVVFADVTAGLGELADREPFDVVVAGELIEHLPCPQALFDFAAEALKPGGSLVITTPNPVALLRVATERRGGTLDNVDHIIQVAPAGLVEMADRTGFVLTVAATTDLEPRKTVAWRSLKGELSHLRHRDRPRPWWVVPLADVLAAWTSWDRGHLGETSLYVLQRKG